MEGMVLVLHMEDMVPILMADMDLNSHTLDMATPMLDLVLLLYMVVTVPDLLLDMVTMDTDLVLPIDMDLHTADLVIMDMRRRMLDLSRKIAVMVNYIDSFVAFSRDLGLIFCCDVFFQYSHYDCL